MSAVGARICDIKDAGGRPATLLTLGTTTPTQIAGRMPTTAMRIIRMGITPADEAFRPMSGRTIVCWDGPNSPRVPSHRRFQGVHMKLAFFDDFKLGVIAGDSVVDVTGVVKDIPRLGPQDVIRGVIDRFDALKGQLAGAAAKGQGKHGPPAKIPPAPP